MYKVFFLEKIEANKILIYKTLANKHLKKTLFLLFFFTIHAAFLIYSHLIYKQPKHELYTKLKT